jgi:hypothetical protein
MNTLRFVLYSFAIVGGLLVIGHCMSIEAVSITTLDTSMLCEKDPILDQYLCYQP